MSFFFSFPFPCLFGFLRYLWFFSSPPNLPVQCSVQVSRVLYMKSLTNTCPILRSLKLKVYRSLGIDVEADKSGTYNKAVIRNNAKGDVHVVSIDPKSSRFFYANYFWRTM